ncbi:helix-turn-helix domain-containing protein [Alkalicoccobacillus porphyridii]|uniref:Helix-turn-helix domain-containing protein n=1 Tax=Alkalicoccobacillus porphyridii TaxID=2597270 RepID=A0A554A0P9_9BACI|nr:AraC family transcriptional regulator [Alkalicoccobacillus porphyridii]TSB47271.1 helix-turn-helix domain-containing protein [Alkalicoccobacillus porphyridii]
MAQEQEVILYESKHQEKDFVQPHSHHTHQILYVLNGQGRCRLNHEEFTLKPDSMMVIPPGTEHSILAASTMTVLILEFSQVLLDTDSQKSLIKPVFSEAKVWSLTLFSSSEIRQLLRKMLYEQSQKNAEYQLGIKLLLSQLLFILMRTNQSAVQPDSNTLRSGWLKEYIDSNFYQITSIEEMAGKMGISSRYMNQMFTEVFDQTPMRYLTEVRLTRVKKMLVETDLDIVTICFEVGFESLSTFYRVFKKQVGVPPNRYRTAYVEKKL